MFIFHHPFYNILSIVFYSETLNKSRGIFKKCNDFCNLSSGEGGVGREFSVSHTSDDSRLNEGENALVIGVGEGIRLGLCGDTLRSRGNFTELKPRDFIIGRGVLYSAESLRAVKKKVSNKK